MATAESPLSIIISKLNSTKLFFNLYLLFTSTVLRARGQLAEADFISIIVWSTGIYFAAYASSTVIKSKNYELPAPRKFTTPEFLNFCMLFVIAGGLFATSMLSSDGYTTLVLWVYALYSGVNVSDDFLKKRVPQLAGLMQGAGVTKVEETTRRTTLVERELDNEDDDRKPKPRRRPAVRDRKRPRKDDAEPPERGDLPEDW